MPSCIYTASIVTRGDGNNVKGNRSLYREKFDAVLDILVPRCRYSNLLLCNLWPQNPIDTVEITHKAIIAHM